MIKIVLSLVCFVFISLSSFALADVPINPATSASATGVQEIRVEPESHQQLQSQTVVSPEYSQTGVQKLPPEVQLPPDFSEHYAPPSTLEEDHFYQEFFKMLSMLGLIIMLLLLASWFLKRLLSSRTEQINNTSMIKIVERRMLSAKSAVYVVDVMGKKIALAESQNGITCLGDVSLKDFPPQDLT